MLLMDKEHVVSSCVAVTRENGQKAIELLKSKDLINRELKVKRAGNEVLIPVINVKESLKVLASSNINARECMDEFTLIAKLTRRELLEKIEEMNGLKRLSYHLIGDILVINLKGPEEAEKARVTASVLMNHFKNIKSVYGKIGTFDEFRIPKLIHLGGEKDTFTIAKEYDLSFAVDIAKVFYNPRLADEHKRVSMEINNGSLVLDMFSGVGGFCIHVATSIKGEVHCNDINPHAVSLLNISIIMNTKKLLSPVYTWNLDARGLPSRLKRKFDVIIMNHPTGSLDFIDVADSLLKPGGKIYLYILGSKSEDIVKEDVTDKLMEKNLSYSVEYKREVLEHSPSKSVHLFNLYKEKQGLDNDSSKEERQLAKQ
jgi:tRNA (guanine37-N1)-methyltransferase